MLLDGGTIFGGDARLAHHGVQAVQAAEGVEVALADLAGVGDQIARVGLAKGELLDDANVGRFAQYLRRVSDKTQFIVITHRRGTMEAANVLYGVTMQEDGVSKLLKLDLEQVDATLVS